jgi:cell division protein FtsB
MKKEKRENYSFWHSPIALVIFFFVLIMFGYNLVSIIQKEKETRDKKNMVLDQINDLQKRNDSFKKEISKLETEYGKEEVIREKYQVAKEGEKMIIITEEEEIVKEEVKKSLGFFDWLKSVFLK